MAEKDKSIPKCDQKNIKRLTKKKFLLLLKGIRRWKWAITFMQGRIL